MPMIRDRRTLTIALAVATLAAGASASSPETLAAALAPHRDAWQPCQVLVGQLKENARAIDQALLAGRDKDAEKAGKQADKLMKALDKKCGPIKNRMVAALQQTGASQEEMDAAWSAFTATFDEAPAGGGKK
jgi:hypothetical protein